jgi:hypothetical protein
LQKEALERAEFESARADNLSNEKGLYEMQMQKYIAEITAQKF